MDRAADHPRKMGRPRAVQGVGGEDPRVEILDAAAELFTRLGYTRTTTRQIAEAVGLRQGSLFHYFGRKQDILDELLRATIEPAMATAAWLEDVDAAAEVKLFLLVKHDASNLCALPHNLGALYFQPEIKVDEFAEHWERRESLRAIYERLVEGGATSGRFDVDDTSLATDLVFGLVESTCTWFDPKGNRSPEDVGRVVARAALRMLLAPRADVEKVQADAVAAGGAGPDLPSSPL